MPVSSGSWGFKSPLAHVDRSFSRSVVVCRSSLRSSLTGFVAETRLAWSRVCGFVRLVFALPPSLAEFVRQTPRWA